MVLGPEIAVRIGHGTVLCVISPLLGHIADIRHNSEYGAVYGLYTASYNLGLAIGKFLPTLESTLQELSCPPWHNIDQKSILCFKV